MMSYPTMWSKKALVTLTKKGGTDINFQTIIETVDIDEGEAPVTEISTIAGGRLIKFEPRAMTTVTFEGYPVGISVEQDEALGFSQQANSSNDTTQPLSTSPTHELDLYRCTIMWTNETTVAQAVDSVSTGYQAYRWYAKDCYIYPPKKSFTDKGLKFTVTVKCPVFDKSGSALIFEEGSDGTTTLPALSAYT